MKLKIFFQLLQWKNILILILTQAVIKIALINVTSTQPTLPLILWSLLIASITLITASGQVLNNSINVGVSKNKIPQSYYILNTFGIILVFFLAFEIQKPIYSLIFIAGSLLLYSRYTKKNILIRKLLNSILIGSSIFIPVLFEQNIQHTSFIYKLIITYSVFCFGIHLIKEIINDIVYIDRDYSLNRNTLPILIGRNRTNKLLFILSLVIVFSLFYLLLETKKEHFHLFLYGTFLIILPLLYFISKLQVSKTKQSYKKLSSLLKLILVLGILSIFVI